MEGVTVRSPKNHLPWKCFPWYFYSNSILLLMFLLAFTSFCYPILFGCCLQLAVCQMQIRHPVGIKLIPKIRCFSGLKMNSMVTVENIFCKVVTNYGCNLVRRSVDKISVSWPWLVNITLGTRQKLRSGRLFLSFPQPTTRQNEGLACRR